MKAKLLTLSIMALLAVAFTTTSCNKDDDGPSGCSGGLGWAFAVTDEINAYTAAFQEWQANPTTENCEDYIDAYQDYLNALRDYDNCVSAANRADWQDAIDEAIEDIEETDCE